MRIGHLLLTVGFMLFVSAAAQSQADRPGQPLRFDSNNTEQLDKAQAAYRRIKPRLSPQSDPDLATLMGFPGNADPVCLRLRSYRVARTGRNSDVVEPAGYTTCVPSSKYSVKRAVTPAHIPPQ